MTKLLDQAIAEVRALPDDEQDAVAELLLEIARQPEDSLLTEGQLAEAEIAFREAEQGKIASKERVAALWRKFGL